MRKAQGYFVGGVLLGGVGVLAGCSGTHFVAEREAWRHEAESQCLGSGVIVEGAGVARSKPINGPGMCGADFPLRVSALAVNSALGYSDDVRPPGGVPGAAAMPPRWPISEPRMVDPRAVDPRAADPRYVSPNAAPYDDPRSGALSLPLDPPPSIDGRGGAIEPYDFRRPYQGASAPGAVPRGLAPQAVPLGPARGPATEALASVAVNPAATLACPIVSALDQWIANAVQPAALRWFGQQVVEIRQISAYSCRGMNGNPNARISEHAFGNALDIAAFTLADGRKIVVKTGWHGVPEEQGFLRDVQGAACEQFTTVLAPGSNAYHYDHIHVDLMRRRDGHRACNPRAVSGEEVAARARGHDQTSQRGDASITGAIGARRTTPQQRVRPNAYADERPNPRLPFAEPGNDGEE